MHLEAQAVPCAMYETSLQASLLEDATRRGVHLFRCDARAQRLPCRLLRLEYCSVPATHLRRRAPHADRARQIARIAAQYSTEVKHDQLVFLHELPAGTSMRPRPTFARGDDGIEGGSVRALSPHTEFNFGG